MANKIINFLYAVAYIGSTITIAGIEIERTGTISGWSFAPTFILLLCLTFKLFLTAIAEMVEDFLKFREEYRKENKNV